MVFGWLIVAGILVIAELNSGTFYMLLLACSCLLCALGAVLGLPLYAQGLLFIAASLLLFVYLRPLLQRWLPRSKETVPTVSSSLVGQRGRTVRELMPGEQGQVKVGGEIWTAVSEEPIRVGEEVVITAVHVSKLDVMKAR